MAFGGPKFILWYDGVENICYVPVLFFAVALEKWYGDGANLGKI